MLPSVLAFDRSHEPFPPGCFEFVEEILPAPAPVALTSRASALVKDATENSFGPFPFIQLTPLDCVMPKTGTTVLQFLPSLVSEKNSSSGPPNFPTALILEILRKSLEQMLNQFPEACGRLSYCSPDSSSPSGGLQINLNNSGILFVVAKVSNFSYENSSEETRFLSGKSSDNIFCPMRNFSIPHSHQLIRAILPGIRPNAPLLHIQITEFPPVFPSHRPAFSIGLAVHHCLMDGSSMFHFLFHWSQLYSRTMKSIEFSMKEITSAPPVQMEIPQIIHHREWFQYDKTTNGSSPTDVTSSSSSSSISPVSSADCYVEAESSNYENVENPMQKTADNGVNPIILEFSPEEIAAMKAAALQENSSSSSSSSPVSYVSSFDCVTAWVWHSIRKLEDEERKKYGEDKKQQKKGENNNSSNPPVEWSSEYRRLAIALNGRPALKADTPTNFYGNVVFFGCPDSEKENQTANKDSDSLSFVSSGVLACRIRSMILEVLQPGPLLECLSSYAQPSTNLAALHLRSDFVATSWSSFPAYECEWFGLNFPSYVGLAYFAFDESDVIFFLPTPQNRPKGTIRLVLAMKSTWMDSLLERFQEFRPYAKKE